MSVRIRLSRGGSKKRPFYRIVIADQRSPRDGRFIEKIGYYNPLLPKENAERIVINAERVKHWLSVGAQPTDRLARMLADLGLAGKVEIPANQTKKPLPKAKAVERAKAKEEAVKAKAEAEAEAARAAEEAKAAPVAEETPAEETPEAQA